MYSPHKYNLAIYDLNFLVRNGKLKIKNVEG